MIKNEFEIKQDDTYAYWKDLVAATDGSVLMRRLPNAEHSCAGFVCLFFGFS